MNRKDLIQIFLNLFAFSILYTSSGGHGSFWAFITFNIIAGIILTEIVLSKDKTALWVWITKTATYIFLSVKFIHNMGEIKIEYICMVTLSVSSLIISRHLIAKRMIALWGQNVAYLIGGYLYIVAIIENSSSFGWAHVFFWVINALSYLLLIQQIYQEKKDKINLTIPVFATVVCGVYVTLILYFSIL